MIDITTIGNRELISGDDFKGRWMFWRNEHEDKVCSLESHHAYVYVCTFQELEDIDACKYAEIKRRCDKDDIFFLVRVQRAQDVSSCEKIRKERSLKIVYSLLDINVHYGYESLF